MYINGSFHLANAAFEVEQSPIDAGEVRIFITPSGYGHVSVYLTAAQAESLAFQLSTTIQEMLTAKESSNA
jgi:hypothetical protein